MSFPLLAAFPTSRVCCLLKRAPRPRSVPTFAPERTRMDLWITDGPLDAATHVIVPHGDIDLGTVRNFKGALDAAIETGARYILVDFGDVGFVESSGIGVLFSPQRALRP